MQHVCQHVAPALQSQSPCQPNLARKLQALQGSYLVRFLQRGRGCAAYPKGWVQRLPQRVVQLVPYSCTMGLRLRKRETTRKDTDIDD